MTSLSQAETPRRLAFCRRARARGEAACRRGRGRAGAAADRRAGCGASRCGASRCGAGAGAGRFAAEAAATRADPGVCRTGRCRGSCLAGSGASGFGRGRSVAAAVGVFVGVAGRVGGTAGLWSTAAAIRRRASRSCSSVNSMLSAHCQQSATISQTRMLIGARQSGQAHIKTSPLRQIAAAETPASGPLAVPARTTLSTPLGWPRVGRDDGCPASSSGSGCREFKSQIINSGIDDRGTMSDLPSSGISTKLESWSGGDGIRFTRSAGEPRRPSGTVRIGHP